MTRTFVSFRGVTAELPTEWEAYVWLLNRFLSAFGNFFVSIDEGVEGLWKGRGGAIMFALSPVDMHQPKRLSNGWYAETCLNEKEKDQNLYLIAQRIGVSSERDYEWQAMSGPKRTHLDVKTLKARLRELSTKAR
jgi:hypothetical protein